MSDKESKIVKEYPTNLKKLSLEMYDLLLRQGYENAKCVYSSYDTNLKHNHKEKDGLERQ